MTPLKLGTTYPTPTKKTSPNARHTMFSSLGSLHSNVKPQQPEKSKSSFLARVTSRPSLSARYSSADLKSVSKVKQDIRGFKRGEVLITPQHIVHGVPDGKRRNVDDDKNFFTSPRMAPTPPSLQFASPSTGTFSQESLVGPSDAAATPSKRRQSYFPVQTENLSPLRRQSTQVYSTPLKAGPRVDNYSPSTLSPSHSRTKVSPSSSERRKLLPSGSGPVPSMPIPENPNVNESVVQPRHGLVRIGSEQVTLSVANVLETELGVNVHDSEEESIYDDSYGDEQESKLRLNTDLASADIATVLALDSDLPPLSASSDDFFNLISKLPPPGRHIEIECKSPLSVLIDASVDDDSGTGTDCSRFSRHPYSIQGQSLSESSLRTYAFPSLSKERRGAVINCLDRISEKSVIIGKELHQEDKDTGLADRTPKLASSTKEQLQQSLKIQCARFDRLAAHLLSIIQRHQNEKVNFENRITALEKEARRREREIKGLRWLLMRSNKGSVRNREGLRQPVRVASIQSFCSVAASDDAIVDLELAVEMLSRSGKRTSSRIADDDMKEGRASPGLLPSSKRTSRVDLRRSKTMPDLHIAPEYHSDFLTPPGQALPSPPQPTPSPDVSGLGLGLEFPLPEPLVLPSISTAIMSSAPASANSVPALTTAPTASSGLSMYTDTTYEECGPPLETLPPPPSLADTSKRSGRSPTAREKRMAREWRPGPSPSKSYRPSDDLAASAAYATNLNQTLSPSIEHMIASDKTAQTVELDVIYKRLVAGTESMIE